MADPLPLISVVMPVHNGEPYLAESIKSILTQTFRDFEFIILDDASTDRTPEILRDWAQRDRRIRLFRSPEQLGLVRALNYVVHQARALVCARMDADDISHPDRLRRQWEVLHAHPQVLLVGTLWEGIDEQGRCVRPRDRWALVRRSPFAPFPHGSSMYRRDVFWEVGGYREGCAPWEDLDLYLRNSKRGRLMVIPDALYRYRFHIGSVTLSSPLETITRVLDLMHRCITLHLAGRDYAHLLTMTPASVDSEGRVSTETLYYLGASRLWAGYSPGILGEFRNYRWLPWRKTTLKTLVLGVGGSLSPSTLRGFLRWWIWLRDHTAGGYFRNGNPVEWRFE
ncbi:MAG: glycosyltransferase family 2 protein [candidate division NC10 bacterium]|nr:glycosyltransferase family 2 protein [candidate division NC10 bacterium]